MSLVTQLTEFATAVGGDVRKLMTFINGRAADLSALKTTAKTNIVAAINELHDRPSLSINDGAATTTTTWSGSKISDELSGKANTGHSHAWDSITSKPTTFAPSAHTHTTANVTGLDVALNNRIRFDAAQTLTAAQKTQVHANLDIGDITTDLEAIYVATRDAT